MESFGIFTNARVRELSPGINIFYGPNGAGKSTCLHFLCSLLSGAAPLGSLRPMGADGKKASGYLDLAWQPEGAPAACHISDNGENGRQTSCDPADYAEYLTRLLALLPADEYQKIFTFDMGTLEQFADSPAEKTNSLLFGATFGAGLLPPSQALAALDHKISQIWGQPEDATSLNGMLRELELKRKELGELETVSHSHDELAKELLEAQNALAETRQGKQELSRRHKLLQRRIEVWGQWTEWQKLRARIDELADAPKAFPADGIKRLELIMASRNSCEQQIATREARIASLTGEREALVCDKAIMELLPRLRRLAERKSSFESALSQMDGLREKQDNLAEETRSALERLGADWTCERIRAIDRSLFAREKLEQLAEELTAAREAHHAALAALSQGNQEVAATEQALAASADALSNLPDPSSELNIREREELQANVARLGECRRQNQSREKTLKNARHALLRALEQAKISPVFNNGVIDNDAVGQTIDKLMQSRQEALDISEELQKHISETEQGNGRLATLESSAENLKKKIDDIQSASRRQPGASEDSIGKRSRALQTLRANMARIESAREKLDEIDNRIAATPKAAKSFRALLVWPGLILLLAGCALFAACHFWEIKELALGTTTIPLSLPVSYAIAAIGVIMLGLGLPARQLARSSHDSQLAGLMASRESGMMEIAVLDRENRDLAMVAGLENTDPITLDATEMLLEREKEQRIHEERSRQDLRSLEQEHEDASNQILQLREEIRKQENEIQNCRKKWQDLLYRVRIGGSPSPESAATVFARVEACKIALENARNAENELNELWEDLHLLESAISSMPAVAKRLAEATEPLGLEEAVRLVLESCKNADKMWEDKIQAQSALKTVENELAKARARQEEAARRLEEANSRQELARENWQNHAVNFGGSQADPQTMREALRLMDKSLATESALEAIKRQIAQNEAEMRDMEHSLSEILHKLALKPSMKLDGLPDWLATLDDLLEKAEKNTEISIEQKRLDSLINSNKEDLAASRAEMASLENRENNLLAQTGARDREQFLNLAEKYYKKVELQDRLQELEVALRNAAGDAPFEDFIDSFAGEEELDAEGKLEAMQAELDKLADEEQKLANTAGLLSARVNGLDQNTDLALLRQQIALLSSALRSKTRAFAEYAFARELMQKSVESYEKNMQPALARQGSTYFSQLADNWQGMSVNIEKKEILLTNMDGQKEKPGQVNRSLKELAWLSLRFSLIQEFAEKNASLPMLLDEVLANFDPSHARRIVEFMDNFSHSGKETQQIIYFTCHPWLVELFQSVNPGVKVFNIENGQINAA